MKKLVLSALVSAALLSIAGVAAADETANGAPKGRGVIVLPPTELTSPPMRPLATIDVARIPARLTLTVLRQPFLQRIESSVFSDQF